MSASGLFSTAIAALGWSLVHFIWQAALVGGLYAIARAVLPRGNPRYLAALLALLAMAAFPVATAWHEAALYASPVDLPGELVTAASAGASIQAGASWNWRAWLDAMLPWLVLAWAAGVGVLGARVYRQCRTLRTILRAAEALPEWQARARAFADRLGLRRVVPVLVSVRVATPTLIGWVRPAVVMPLALLARMPAPQIDLILAHELAHLKRLDPLANLFQVVLETLFFYHPVVHWISREARNERELCCDALALRVTGGERRDFVAALASLEAFRAADAALAVAASGGVLVERAWFIAGAPPGHRQRHLRGNAVAMLAAIMVLSLAGFWWRDVTWQRRVANVLAANHASLLRHVQPDTVRPPGLTPVPHVTRLSSPTTVPYAAVTLPAAEAPVLAAAIKLAPIAAPDLDLGEVARQTRPMPVVPLPARSLAPPADDATPGAPTPVRTVRPVYPSAALLVGLQGRVVIEFELDARGVPRDLRAVASSDGTFNAAALQALADWRFAPPAEPGRRYRQAFTFRLGDAGTAEDAATARACLVTTGTHICRHVDEAADVRVLRPGHWPGH